MLGLNAQVLAESSGAGARSGEPSSVPSSGNGEGARASGASGERLESDSSFGEARVRTDGASDSAAFGGVSPSDAASRDAPRSTPAEETDALEEVRMAVEQLVIPHQESVELLPRDARLLAMQKELIEREYRLAFEECGEGNARRIRILHTYVESA